MDVLGGHIRALGKGTWIVLGEELDLLKPPFRTSEPGRG